MSLSKPEDTRSLIQKGGSTNSELRNYEFLASEQLLSVSINSQYVDPELLQLQKAISEALKS